VGDDLDVEGREALFHLGGLLSQEQARGGFVCSTMLRIEENMEEVLVVVTFDVFPIGSLRHVGGPAVARVSDLRGCRKELPSCQTSSLRKTSSHTIFLHKSCAG